MRGVQAVDKDRTAVPDRYNDLLNSVFILYDPGDDVDGSIDAQGSEYGRRIRDAIVEASGKPLDAYVNYAYGDEGMEAMYGHEAWRIERLRELKKSWDPEGKFNFYKPIQ